METIGRGIARISPSLENCKKYHVNLITTDRPRQIEINLMIAREVWENIEKDGTIACKHLPKFNPGFDSSVI